MADEKKFTLKDLQELVSGIVEAQVNAKGFVPLGQLKDQVKAQLDGYVEKDLKPAFDAEVAKLAKLPGASGIKDVGREDNSRMAGLQKDGGYSAFAMFGRDVYKAGRPNTEPPAHMAKWIKDVNAYEEVIKVAGTPSLSTSDPEYGGILIPPEFSNILMDRGIEQADFVSRATRVPMARNSVKLPYLQDFDHTSFLNGGMMAYWMDELGAKTPSAPKFGRITLDLNKIAVVVYSSDELLEDSPISMEPFLSKKAPEVIKWKLDEALHHGTGAGQPTGILGSPAMITVSKEPGQAADTINWENIKKMFSRMPARNIANAVWITGIQASVQLMGMYMPVGVGGVPVWLPANAAQGAPLQTLLGRPIIYSEHASALGDLGDIMFVDWSEYLVGQKAGAGSGVQFASSIHLMFLYDQTAFRFVLRIDGKPWWPKAYTPKHGETQSPYVALEAR